MNDTYTKPIIKLFANNPFDSFNHKQVASRVGAHDKSSRQLVIATLKELAENNILVPDEHARGKYKINPKNINEEYLPRNYVIGTIDMKQSGKAYVIPNADSHPLTGAPPHSKTDTFEEDILIAPNNTNHALHGDTVKILMFPRRKMHKPEGQVVEILERARTRFVGILQLQDRFAFVVSDSRSMVVDILIPLSDLAGAQDGEKVLVEMTGWPTRLNNPVGRVVKRLGRPGVNNVEMQSILAEYDFPLEFSPEAEHEASLLHNVTPASRSDLKGRRDFRQTTTFTIDPSDAKDFDDALSFRHLGNGNFEVGVHIADVSHYVRPGSAIDREAYERGTSVYLVDRTIPMLPEKLCNDVCSLRPHEDKLCFSVVVEMTPKAEVVRQWFGKAVINSDARLSYDEAQSIIESGESDTQLKEAILHLHSLATILRSKRYEAGSINFESREVKFILDENAKPIGVYTKEDKEANWLIEEFMLLANCLVAEHVSLPAGKNRKTIKNSPARTFVYRVHDEPNPEKLNTFVEFVAKLGFKMRLSSHKALANSYNQLFKTIAGRGEEHMIDSIAIRTMAKAVYSTDNIGHYGLGFRYYTHFTSPIRRYPDLMVHRLLEHYLEQDSRLPDANPPKKEVYEEYCRHCSVMEKRATDAERASIKYKQAEYLSDKVGQVFPALISGVSKWGFYAEIEGNMCEGLIPITSLHDDYYMLDEDNYQVIGRRSGKAYKLGMPIHIRIQKVDMLKKNIFFDLVEEASTQPIKRQPKSKTRTAAQKNDKAKR